MAQITTIPGIGKSVQELLEVAGFLDIEAIAHAGVDDLVAALEKANSILKISNHTPARESVEEWVETAREMTGISALPVGKEAPRQMPVNYEGNAEVAQMLEDSPCAIPLPVKIMVDNKLAVSDIPPAILLNRYSGDLEVRVSDSDEDSRPAAPSPEERPVAGSSARREPADLSRPSPSGLIQRAAVPESRLDIDTSRVKTFEEFSNIPAQRPPRKKSLQENDRVALLRAPREETNRGKNPNSRFFIKGVLHTHPMSLALGAIITLLLMILLPAAILSAGLLFVSDQFPGSLPWVPKWLLAIPAALPVVGFLYLIFGVGGKCRICGQRLFWPRNCRKNSKAHHVPGIGHIIPTALHMLTFKWFRCIYCGTPVRLKK
ncbi:DUF4332 domain-containing protein [Luteolibacter sp. SL250]|uniref:DUF4332 domain-containing protein n=1 Tax=Luteolibacter sp. SL250 TaxID=2995170 RepID=UPI00226F254B|nr:DUF4332 domain-containing protein [Luteolibacter sp. SL250]WAC17881.1 DUF4332 domain-containing protein [Luteolibacter sp. SL250]